MHAHIYTQLTCISQTSMQTDSIHTYTQISTHTYMHVYTHIYACVYMYIHTCTHTQTHTQLTCTLQTSKQVNREGCGYSTQLCFGAVLP